MSITSAMYTGISGLNANGEAISVLGNNISNVNTIGFKSGRMLFSDVLSSSIGNSSQIGRGVQIQSVQNNFSQGSTEGTENATDLAIQGDSFFIVKNPGEAQYYTRAGAFSFDKNKTLVNPDGFQVQGYGINQTTGLNNGSLGEINLTSAASLPPKSTSTVNMVFNLDASSTLPGSSPTTALAITGVLDKAAALNTPQATITDIFNLRDEYGKLLSSDLTMTRTAANTWSWQLDVANASPAVATLTGTVLFDPLTGNFAAQTPTSAQTINLSNGSTPLSVTVDFGSMTEDITANAVAATGTANGITTSKIRLDGSIDTATLPSGANAVTQTVVDADGATHTMYLEFTGTGSILDWTMDTVPSTSPSYPTTNRVTGTATFDASTGVFKSYTQDRSTVTFGTLAPQTLKVDFSGLQQTTTAGLTPALAQAAIVPTAADVWDPANPATTSNFSSSTTIYDSLGNPHSANIYFVNTGANSWDWHAQIPDATGGSPINGSLAFNAAGILTSQTPTALNGQNILLGGGVTVPQPIAFNFGTDITTQYSATSQINSLTQDGYYQGSLSKIQVDQKGYVIGVYSNGQSQKLAQIALARFASTAGLSKAGGTLYEETLASGQALLSDASTPGVGKVLSNSLEQSNVDMAAQFVKLIQAQRAFSANSKTITTSDEMTQEVLNLKR